MITLNIGLNGNPFSYKKHWAVMAALILAAGLADNLSDDPAAAPKHACIDTTHATCDGECECDSYECE